MISATLLAVFLVPVFYVTIRRIFKGGKIVAAHGAITSTTDSGKDHNPPKS
jgi:hypothetical protein